MTWRRGWWLRFGLVWPVGGGPVVEVRGGGGVRGAGGGFKAVANTEDTWKWDAENSGMYSTKSAYKLIGKRAEIRNELNNNLKRVWCNLAPSKLKQLHFRGNFFKTGYRLDKIYQKEECV